MGFNSGFKGLKIVKLMNSHCAEENTIGMNREAGIYISVRQNMSEGSKFNFRGKKNKKYP